MGKLTAKQERFCKEYITDFNGSQAAIRAGYSESTAKEIASENLTKPNIVARIEELKQPIEERLGITAEFVLNGFKQLAKSGEKDSDKNKAFENLAKYIGLFEKHNQQKSGKQVIQFQLPDNGRDEDN